MGSASSSLDDSSAEEEAVSSGVRVGDSSLQMIRLTDIWLILWAC